jgi:Tfp pilus assembly protein PilZ
MSAPKGPEHRRGPRVARHFLVRYRPLRDSDAEWLVSPLRDLSSGGARFLSERQFAAGDVMMMQLILPVSSQPIELKARVAWTRKSKVGTAITDLGVTFETQDVFVQRTLETAIAHLLKRP